MIRRTVPVAVYRDGVRYVVGEAGVEVEDDGSVNWRNVEVNITNPVLSEIISPVKNGDFSIGRPRDEAWKDH